MKKPKTAVYVGKTDGKDLYETDSHRLYVKDGKSYKPISINKARSNSRKLSEQHAKAHGYKIAKKKSYSHKPVKGKHCPIHCKGNSHKICCGVYGGMIYPESPTKEGYAKYDKAYSKLHSKKKLNKIS